MKEVQLFSMILEEADHGRIDKILSTDIAHIIDVATSKASLHDTEWSGELAIKVKIKCEPHGKVCLSFTTTSKVDREPLPKARMYYDPDTGTLSNDVPRQVKIKFDNEAPRETKSAKAPGKGDN